MIKTIAKEGAIWIGSFVLGQVIVFTTLMTIGVAGQVMDCIDIQPKCKKS